MSACSFFHGAVSSGPQVRRAAGEVWRRAGFLFTGCVLALSAPSAAHALGWGTAGGVAVNGAPAATGAAPMAVGSGVHAAGRGGGTVNASPVSTGPVLRAGGNFSPGANVVTGPRPGLIAPTTAGAFPSRYYYPRFTPSTTTATTTRARVISPNLGYTTSRGSSLRPARALGDTLARNPDGFRADRGIRGGQDRLGNNNAPAGVLRDSRDSRDGHRRASWPRIADRGIFYPGYPLGNGLTANNGLAPGGLGYYGNGYGYGLGAAGCALGFGTFPFYGGYSPVYAALSYPVFIASGSSYATDAALADAGPPATESAPAPAPAAAEENAPSPAARRPPAGAEGGTTTARADEPNSVVEAVQEELVRRGYLAGKPNGFLSAGTQEALRHFQANHGLPPTGRVNEATLFKLGLN